MSKILLLVYLWYFVSVVQAQIVTSADARCGDNKLSGFVISPYFGEQEMSFVYPPGINIRINAPSIAYSGGYPFSISGDIRSVPS